MIVKPREKSFRLLAHEAGIRRVRKNHPKYPFIEKEYYQLHYGYQGEKAMDYYSSFLPSDNYKILHGLRLQDTKGRYFQMDSLLINPSHGIILDSKYITGILEFDLNNGILVRHKEEGQERMGDPFSQSARHKMQLEGLIHQMKIPWLPIYTQVVLTHNQTRLHPNTPSLQNKLSFHTNLPTKIKNIFDLHKNNNNILSNNELKKLALSLNKRHKIDSFNFMEFYGLTKSDLIKGAICTNCSFSPMYKSYQVWQCRKCKFKDKNPVNSVVMDYLHLGIGNTLTNREFRDFMCIDSVFVASKVLASQNLPYSGNTKARIYTIK